LLFSIKTTKSGQGKFNFSIKALQMRFSEVKMQKSKVKIENKNLKITEIWENQRNPGVNY